jgi:fatty acid synthase subunit alpha, fungi type
MRQLKTSITRSLCEQVLTSPIHWTKSIDFPSTATHAVDFGPGGLSGIGPLTARHVSGRGIRVVVVGDKGKGDAELYDSQKVQRESNWGTAFAPSLVRTRSVPQQSFYRSCFKIFCPVMAPFI